MQVGLAVGDTKTMKKYATIKRLGMQLEYQFEIEEAYPKYITRKVYERVYVEKPNKLPRVNRYTPFLPNGGNKAYVCVCFRIVRFFVGTHIRPGSDADLFKSRS